MAGAFKIDVRIECKYLSTRLIVFNIINRVGKSESTKSMQGA